MPARVEVETWDVLSSLVDHTSFPITLRLFVQDSTLTAILLESTVVFSVRSGYVSSSTFLSQPDDENVVGSAPIFSSLWGGLQWRQPASSFSSREHTLVQPERDPSLES